MRYRGPEPYLFLLMPSGKKLRKRAGRILRKRAGKTLRKLVREHGSELTVAIITGILSNLITDRVTPVIDRPKKGRRGR